MLWATNGVVVATAVDWDLASDESGGAIIVWADGDPDFSDVLAQRLSGATGAPLWTPGGAPVCTAIGPQTYPVIAEDGFGGAMLAWADGRGGLDSDIYVTRIDPNGVAVTGWPANGIPACGATGDQFLGKIMADTGGRFILAWRDERNGNRDIYVNRVDRFANVLWGSSGVPVATSGIDEEMSYSGGLVDDGSGGVIVTWQGFAGWPNPDELRAQRISSAGTAQWSSGGVLLRTGEFSGSSGSATTDGSGGMIVFWGESVSGSYVLDNVRAQRLNAAGNLEWPDSGAVVADSVFSGNLSFDVVSDGVGGAIVCWWGEENSAPYESDIFAQRVDGNGSVQWPVKGVVVCGAIGNQWFPTMTTDAAGGAIIAWDDFRNGGLDSYAQRIGPDGSPIVTGVPKQAPAPSARLWQNAPNPFNPTTTITYDLAQASRVSLHVYDVSGRLVRALRAGVTEAAGRRSAVWDGRDDAGRIVSSGVYFYQLHAGAYTEAKRMVLLK